MAGEAFFREGIVLGELAGDPVLRSLVLSVRETASASDEAVPSEKAVAAALDGALIGPAGATDGAVPLFDGTSGSLLKDSGRVPAAANGLATLSSDGLLAAAQVRGSYVTLLSAPGKTATGAAGSIGYFAPYVYFWYADNKVVKWAAISDY